MIVFGIELRRPSFNQVTSATILAVGLWVAALGLARAGGVALTLVEAVAALAVLLWSCIAVQMGVDVARGRRHLALNVVVNSLLLGACQGAAWALAA